MPKRFTKSKRGKKKKKVNPEDGIHEIKLDDGNALSPQQSPVPKGRAP